VLTHDHRATTGVAPKDLKNLIFRLCKTIFRYFPDLYDEIREIEDCRKKKAGLTQNL